mmetsp:Transcript_104188/g.324944  ORF Transcript_104188/g.324944 Transcript_104188/m.324944 type:complete len:209 (-) Transcript_104188:552-1178(-)
MRSERSCRHLQTSCCTKMECTLCWEPHIRMHASKNSWKVMVPSWSRSMIVCSVAGGTLRLMPKADMMSRVSLLVRSSRRSCVLTSLWKFSSMLLKSVISVVRNWSDSAAKEASSVSCSRESKMMRCTMTPTIKFTSAKFVKMIMPTKYTAHHWLCLMAVLAMSGQFSRVTTQKCVKRAVPSEPKYLSTSGSSAFFGCPMSSTVATEPV